jgi:glutathione S-transferase
MLTLYHATQSRSIRPRWVLEELGVPYRMIRLDLPAQEHKKPEYLRVNPNGTVPTLVDDDLAIYESAAICQYLADKFPEKHLAPPLGSPQRGLYYQWNHYAMSALEPPIIQLFMHRVQLPEAERSPKAVDAALAAVGPVLDVVERALAGREYVVGERFTVADVMIGSTVWWGQTMGLLDASRPNIGAYVQRLAARPALQRASAD